MKKILLLLLFISFKISFAQGNEYMLAENYFRNNEFAKALQYYKKLCDKSPYNSTYIQKLVSCYHELENYDAVEKLLQQKLTTNPKAVYLNVLLGENYERQKKLDTAKKYYEKALSDIETVPGYASTVGQMFKNINKLDYAIIAYKKAEEKHKNSNFGFQIAQLYGEKGDFNQMFEAFIDYLDKDKKHLNTVKSYAGRYVTDDAENENNILFKKALLRRSMSKPKDEWNNLLSWLFAKQKDYGKALIQEKALYTRNENNLYSIMQLGTIAFNAKDYSATKKCFDFIIENTKNKNQQFKAISKNIEIAIKTKQPNIEEQFEKIFKEYGVNRNTLPVQLVYANYLTFEKNNPEKATEVLDKALKYPISHYKKADIKLMLGEILVYQNKFNKALIYFSQIQTKFPNHELGQEARFKVAQTSYFKKDFKWAKAQTKVLKGSATQLIANDSAELFLIISDNQPKDSIPTGLAKFANANLQAYQNKTENAIQILDEITTEFKGQPIEDEAYFEKGKLYTKQGNFEKATGNFEKVISIDKEGILVDDSLYALAELFRKQEKLEQAKKYFEKIVLNHPSSIYLVDARKKYRKLRGDNISN